MNLVPRLTSRVQIRKAVHVPNSSGGLDLTFETVSTVWAEAKPKGVGFVSLMAQAVRGVQPEIGFDNMDFTMRMSAVENLGKEFARSFSIAFKNMADLAPLKSEYYLFLQAGTTVKGRLFRVKRISRDESWREYVVVGAEEVDERGTGFGGH